MRQRYTQTPFPPYRHRPGETPHPTRDPTGHSFDRPEPPEPFLYGLDLFNHGYFWEAHEIWESLWTGEPPASDRAIFLQGLIQFAAASLKKVEGNVEGCRRLKANALEKFERLRTKSIETFMGMSLSTVERAIQGMENAEVAQIPLHLEDSF